MDEQGYLVGLKKAIENKWPDMKFSVCIGNPPYGDRSKKGSSAFLHLQIMKTVLDFCTDKLCFIMPSKPITSQLDKNGIWYNMFKNAVCTDVTTVKKGTFPNTNMDDTAIYYIDRKPGAKFCIKFNVDEALYTAIDDDAHRLFIDKMNKVKSIEIKTNTRSSKDEELKKVILDSALNSLEDGKYYFNVSRAGVKPGDGEQIWLSGDFVDVDILNKEDEENFIKNIHTGEKNIIECPNQEYGKNLKTLMMKGYVLRYGLWLTQTNQHIYQAQFKYVPDKDYTTIDTDEKLLSVCGFSDDEIKVVMKYLKDFDFTRNRNDVVRGTEEEP